MPIFAALNIQVSALIFWQYKFCRVCYQPNQFSKCLLSSCVVCACVQKWFSCMYNNMKITLKRVWADGIYLIKTCAEMVSLHCYGLFRRKIERKCLSCGCQSLLSGRRKEERKSCPMIRSMKFRL